MKFPLIDIVILVIFAIAIFKGIKDGFIKQIGGIAGLLLGFFLAYKFSSLLSGWLKQWLNASESIVKIVSFALIIIAVILCMSLIGKLVEKIIKITTLGWLNRLLGVIFALFAAVLIVGVFISLINYVNESWFVLIPSDKMSESKLIGPITKVTDVIFPYLKTFFTTTGKGVIPA